MVSVLKSLLISVARYPGVACDIPSANYQVITNHQPSLVHLILTVPKFHWARNPRWKRFYSFGDEIEQYFKDVVDRHCLRQYIHLNHKVTGAYWDNENGVWNVHVENLVTGRRFVEHAEVFVNNNGLLK